MAALIGAPIYVTPEVMAEAGRALGEEPEETAPTRPAVSELDRLTAQLERLVAEEAYEEAATLRDHISDLVRRTEGRTQVQRHRIISKGRRDRQGEE